MQPNFPKISPAASSAPVGPPSQPLPSTEQINLAAQNNALAVDRDSRQNGYANATTPVEKGEKHSASSGEESWQDPCSQPEHTSTGSEDSIAAGDYSGTHGEDARENNDSSIDSIGT